MSAPETPPPRRGLPAIVWVLLGAGLICVLAGLAVARFGPTLFPRSPPPAPAPAALSGSVDARLADIQARLADREPVPPAPEQVAIAAAQVDVLSTRLDRIERRQQDALDAAAAALAVASLDQAAVGSGAFADQLKAVESFLPASPDVATLRGLAAAGAPSRAALAADFPAVAARAAAAAQAGVEGDGLMARIARAAAAVITIRRVDRATGAGPDAVLVRAEAKVNDGDLEAALVELDALPPPARAAVAAWRRRAEGRVQIDRSLAAIRAQALEQLARREQDLAVAPAQPPVAAQDPAP